MPNLSSTSNSKPRNPLAAIWIFAAAIVLVETTLALLPNNALVTTFHTQRVPTVSPTWQIMGDSVAYGGIIATQLAATLPSGQTVVNQAIRASGPEFTYFQLKREIDAGRAPKAILYAPSPHTFATKRTSLLVGGFCTWPEVAEIGTAGIDPLDVLYGVLCKMSYTLRYRDDIASAIKGSGNQRTEDPTGPAADSPPPTDKSHPRFTPANLNQTYKRPFLVNPFNDYFLQKFLCLAATNKIPVIWLTPPVLSAVYESRKQFDFERDYLQYLAGFEQRGLIQVWQGRFLVWDEGYFKDSSHLTPEGARRLTTLVADKIKEWDASKNQVTPP